MDSLYRATTDHNTPLALLSSGEIVYLSWYGTNLVEAVKLGDSLVKQEDSLAVRLKRQGNVYIFYPDCQGTPVYSLDSN